MCRVLADISAEGWTRPPSAVAHAERPAAARTGRADRGQAPRPRWPSALSSVVWNRGGAATAQQTGEQAPGRLVTRSSRLRSPRTASRVEVERRLFRQAPTGAR